MKTKSNRAYNLDVIRCTAFLLVFTFHFALTAGFSGSVRGYDAGSMGTAVFFILSGFLLSLSSRDELPAQDSFPFYKKRALAIYPLYWMVFLPVCLLHGWRGGNFLYGGPLWKILYSFLAADGYLNLYGVRTYYVTGEWFITVILFCYLLYPLLIRARKKKTTTVILTILLFAGYMGNQVWGIQKGIPADASLFTGVFLFWVGMLLAVVLRGRIGKVREEVPGRVIGKMHGGMIGEVDGQMSGGKNAAFWGLIPAAVCAILLLLPVPAGAARPLFLRNLFSLSLFLFLFYTFINLKEKAGKIFAFVSRYTYAAYLWHHVILSWTVGRIMNLMRSAGAEAVGDAAAYIFALIMTGVFSAATIYLWNILKERITYDRDY